MVCDAFNIADGPVGGGKIQAVMLAQSVFLRKTHDEVDKGAVDEVDPLFHLVKQTAFFEIKSCDYA